jgi:hypothetical protein
MLYQAIFDIPDGCNVANAYVAYSNCSTHTEGAACATLCKYDGEKSYQKGLEDAWEVAKKIVLGPEDGGMSENDLFSAFGRYVCQAILREWTITKVIEAMEEWEKKRKDIHVGDEIWDKDGECKAVVMDEGNDGDIIVVLTENGCVEEWERCEVSKSGKHHNEVTELVEKLREEG